LDILLERGMLYSNFHQADDIPYWWVKNGHTTRLLEIPFDWILSDSTQYLTLLTPWIGQPRAPHEALAIWKAEFDGAYREGRYFVLTVHPQWSGRHSRVDALRELLEYIGGHDGVWWATMREVAEHWHATQWPGDAEPELNETGTSALGLPDTGIR